MAIISFDKDSVIDYVPAYGGNRDSDDPTIVRLRFVPYSKVQHYSRVIAARTKEVKDPGRITEITHEVQRREFVENVEGVDNYYVGAREVKDPGEFYDTADSALVMEVVRAMESHEKLTEGQRKN